MLRRLGDGFSEVLPVWRGLTVACIATGPSLTAEQCRLVAEAKLPVIAVNDAYLWAPFADVLYFADEKWWKWHKDRPEFQAFRGEMVTIEPTGKQVNAHMLRNAGVEGLSLDKVSLCNGRNSGYQAINLAVLAGASRILLLGYDGKKAEDGRTHCHAGHPDKTHGGLFAKHFRTMVDPLKKLGVEIINCTPGSAIDAFPMAELEDAIKEEPCSAL